MEQITREELLADEDFGELRRNALKESKDDWVAYLPTIIAVVREGYLDNYLQAIAQELRERYFEIKEGQNGSGLKLSDNISLLGENGYLVSPSRRNITMVRKQYSEFEAFGNYYYKADFVGQHFRINSSYPVGYRNCIAKVVRTMRIKFQAVIVATPDRKLIKDGLVFGMEFKFNERLFVK